MKNFNEDNPYRFHDEQLAKVKPTVPWYGKWLMIVRLIAIVALALVLLLPMLALQLVGKIYGRRSLHFLVTKFWAHWAARLIGLRLCVRGKVMREHGVVVANHLSPADTIVLMAACGGYMIAKSEVRQMPIIGFFAMLAGAQFIERTPKKAKDSVEELCHRIDSGDLMIFHPEATTTDGLRILNFKSTLFAALFKSEKTIFVQPVTLIYHAPKGASDNFYGWWGQATLETYIYDIATLPGTREVEVHFSEPIKVEGDRKNLSKKAEEVIRGIHTERLRARNIEPLA